MAEFLIKAINATHNDATKNIRDCHKRGDLIAVFENGHEWGAKELKAPADGGKFVVLKVTDVTVQQVINFFQNRWNCHPLAEQLDNEIRVCRHRIKLEADSLPANVRNQLNNTGQFTTTWTAIRQFVRDKLTNETAD